MQLHVNMQSFKLIHIMNGSHGAPCCEVRFVKVILEVSRFIPTSLLKIERLFPLHCSKSESALQSHGRKICSLVHNIESQTTQTCLLILWHKRKFEYLNIHHQIQELYLADLLQVSTLLLRGLRMPSLPPIIYM
jgi:hypothetical protein